MNSDVIERIEDAGRSIGNVLLVLLIAVVLIWLTRRIVDKFIEAASANAVLVDRIGDHANRLQTISRVLSRISTGSQMW